MATGRTSFAVVSICTALVGGALLFAQAGSAAALCSALLVVGVVALVYSAATTRRQFLAGQAPTALILLGTSVISVGIGLSGLEEIANPAGTVLVRTSVTGTNEAVSLPPSLWLSLAGLCSVGLATLIPPFRAVHASKRPPSSDETRRAHSVLLTMAAMSIGISGTTTSATFVNRGSSSGEGLASLLFWRVTASVCLAVVNRHWGSRWRVVGSLLLVGYLIDSGNRSPLLVVICAIAVRALASRHKRGITGLVVATPIAIPFLAAMSLWRGARAQGLPIPLTSAFTETVKDPLASMTFGGFDTLPGLQFALDLEHAGVHAPWWTPLMSVGNFVPRQIWPSKPHIFGSVISQRYIGFSKGGIFFSGTGYLILLTGSALLALVAYAAVTRGGRAYLSRRPNDLMVATLVLYGAIRFGMAGDPFDIYSVLQVLFIYWLARRLGRLGARILIMANASPATTSMSGTVSGTSDVTALRNS